MSFLSRPITFGIVVLAVLALAYGVFSERRHRRTADVPVMEDGEPF